MSNVIIHLFILTFNTYIYRIGFKHLFTIQYSSLEFLFAVKIRILLNFIKFRTVLNYNRIHSHLIFLVY